MATGVSERDKLFAYMPVVFEALLDKHCKSLLLFYAWAFNWSHWEESWYSEKEILDKTGLGNDAYRDARKKLEKLGWISTWRERKHGHTYSSVCVIVLVGRDDPDVLTKRGGRNPLETSTYQALVSHLLFKHPKLGEKRPNLRKIEYPAENQSTNYRKTQLEGRKHPTNNEEL